MRYETSINSSFIEQVSYDTWKHTCAITINGSDVYYMDVSFEQFIKFMREGSKGSYGVAYNMYVRGRW